MPRNMSFMLTTEQIRNRTKTVTRRLGWDFLKPGDIINACEKCMGLKKGEKIVKLATLRVTDKRKIDMESIDDADLVREGFPEMSRSEFVEMFCRTHKCSSGQMVNRIEFEYIDTASTVS